MFVGSWTSVQCPFPFLGYLNSTVEDSKMTEKVTRKIDDEDREFQFTQGYNMGEKININENGSDSGGRKWNVKERLTFLVICKEEIPKNF